MRLAFSPDSKRLAAGFSSIDKTVRVLDIATAQEVLKIPAGGVGIALAFSPDGKILATGAGGTWPSKSESGTVKLWNAATGKEVMTLPCPKAVLDMAFSPDGRRLATAAPDTITLWDVAAAKHTSPSPACTLPWWLSARTANTWPRFYSTP